MKRLFLAATFVLVSFITTAQKYYMGIGGRAGKFNSGLTFKYFFNTDNATGIQLDAYYVNVASGGYAMKAMIIKQIPFKLPIVQLPLDFVYGGGAHAGYFPYEEQGYYKREEKDANYYTKSVVTIGIDVTAQVEYKIAKVPFTLAVEAVPFYDLVNPGPEFVDVGVSVRYIFK